MKNKILLIFFLGLFSSTGWSQSASTNSGYAACISEEWLNDFISFAGANDRDSIQAYLDSGKCVSLKNGLKVTLMDTSGFLGSKVQFVFKGVKFWTVREALSL